MQPLVIGDVLAAARALLAVPPGRRAALCLRLYAEAERADAHRRRTGRPHPRWGDGSLMGAALRRRPPGEPALSDPAFRACLVAVLLAADRYPRAQDRQAGIDGSAASRAASISSPHSVQ